MATRGRTEEHAPEEGLYVCEDGCERRYYRKGERLLHCSVSTANTTWTRVEEI